MAITSPIVTLQNANTMTGNGVAVTINSETKIGLQVFGTSTSCTLIAEVSLDGENWSTIGGINIKDQRSIVESIETSVSAINMALEYDVERWSTFRCRISSIDNGNVTVLLSKLAEYC